MSRRANTDLCYDLLGSSKSHVTLGLLMESLPRQATEKHCSLCDGRRAPFKGFPILSPPPSSRRCEGSLRFGVATIEVK